jgi:hypothetical protein
MSRGTWDMAEGREGEHGGWKAQGGANNRCYTLHRDPCLHCGHWETRMQAGFAVTRS